LASAGAVTPSLFEDVADHAELNKAVDSINQRFGKNKIIFAGMQHARNSAPERIAFNKTWLFSEGKGDHDDIDTFRGQQR
jgi:DNA polymerase-4